AEYTAKIIETYSRDFGMYVYNKMVVADARDGMEYPMLTLDGDADPGYRDLLAHEVGHNWFFGMVGSNETYRASLDEGFTQFLTAWALENIDGKQTLRMPHPNAYIEKFTVDEPVRYTTVYKGYLRDALREDETTLNTHSDDFGGALRHGGGYGNVYYKTATMLYNLQYVLGDTLFLRAMKHYFDQWKMAHPYPEDFRNSIIQFSKVDLNWFFDQWFETYKTIDYKVYKPKDLGDGKYRLRIKRKGTMQMPLDVRVTDADGKFHNYYIPNTWFEKSTSAQILPRWIGWGKLNPVYETEITVPAGIDNVEIDTTGRLADVIRYNNTLKNKQTVKLDARVQNPSDWNHYEMFARPDVWFNFYDGLKLGLHMNGNYMQQRHKFELSFWLNNGLGKVQQSDVSDMNGYNLFSFSMRYQTPTHRWVKHSRALTEARYLDGLRLVKLGWEVDLRSDETTFYVFGKYMERRDTSDINYLMYRKEWNPAAINMTLNTGLRHSYSYKRGTGNIHLGLRTTAPGSDYDFSQLSLEVINDNYLRKWNFRTRFFAQYGSGSNWAPESQLYLAGANPEQLMENKFTRSAAFMPESFNGYGPNINHFHAGGGLNVRGYSGYAAPHTLNNGSVIPLYKGTSGVSGNIEIDLDHLAPLKPRITRKWLKMDVYLFGDAGYLAPNLNQEPFKIDHIRASAGAGTALTIKSWGPLTMERPLVLRFDVPFFINRTPDVSPDYLQFRWVVGVNRSF
ncbi:MAG: M1 family aminopeptidase, partial [Bacteroidia bacterium]